MDKTFSQECSERAGFQAPRKTSHQPSRPSKLLSQSNTAKSTQHGKRKSKQQVAHDICLSESTDEVKASRLKWVHAEDVALVNALFEMVNSGAYKLKNGFKPGYLTHLEQAIRDVCPGSGIRAKLHIKSPEAWRYKSFPHYGKCCQIFGSYRAKGEDAPGPDDVFEEENEVNDSSGHRSKARSGSWDNFHLVEDSSWYTEPQQLGSEEEKKGHWHELLAESMYELVQIMVVEISKATLGISAAIIAERNLQKLVLATMDEVPKLSHVEKAICAVKIMGHNV
ncbi:hypothetical protein Syun_023510 [Stephania yunnanensis]|uniref:Myb/SANT-like domain-containing protein n=1 Tax=Stephania yunnanensis TaxID=152371 RepID=A0AAP0FP97_9MAGN